jgi:hypothetical protein
MTGREASFPFEKPTPVATLFAAATLLALASTLQAGVELGYFGEPIPWMGLLKARLVNWYLYALFVPLLWWLALACPIRRRRLIAPLLVHASAGIACALAKEALFVAIGEYFRPGVFRLPAILAEDYLDEVLTFWALSGVCHAVIFNARSAEGPSPASEENAADHFSVRDRGGIRLVRTESVEWIDAQGNYARLHTASGTYLVRRTMASLERELAPQFVRVHRRTMVNRDRVTRAESLSHGAYRIVLACGAAVVSARSFNASVRRLLG